MRLLFPLNCACGLRSEIVENAVYAFHFVDDSVGNSVENGVGNFFNGSSHSVLGIYGADDSGPTFITFVISDTNALHIGHGNEILPYFGSKTAFVKFFTENGISFTERMESVTSAVFSGPLKR